MRDFYKILNEGFGENNIMKAVGKIAKVLERRLGQKWYNVGVERVVSGGEIKDGVRFYINDTLETIRINVIGGNVDSIDWWKAKKELGAPDLSIDLKNKNSVQLIDEITLALQEKKIGEVFTEARKPSQSTLDFCKQKGITYQQYVKEKKKYRNDMIKWKKDNGKTITVKKGKKEKRISTSAEKDYEKMILQMDPVDLFQDLKDMVDMVITKVHPALLITGKAGTGKSWTVEQKLKEHGKRKREDWVLLKGATTPFGLYKSLYDNQERIIVYDDCDDVFKDTKSVNILKAALDSKDVREISWKSKTTMSRDKWESLEPEKREKYESKGWLPDEFEFSGQIIFISNIPQSKMDKAIISRSFTLEVTMSDENVIKLIENLLPELEPDKLDMKTKKKTLEIFARVFPGSGKEISIRSFLQAAKTLKSGAKNALRIIENHIR